ncbi:hypothetical protein [Marinifilum sp. D714]|uniref:hypothetical protein n=1 Tax=Marinifilum sp. D714 TaxID=2937523 RepID=UPI0027C0D9EF|nr:hypothetical protein [Marinifilum sp. D714]MDQ2178406.1 hypothetical protein [Marinifilum sp. D714]
MKTIKRILSICLITLTFISCGKNEKLIQSEETVNNFFSSVNKENAELMKKYYPGISTFDSYFKSDSILIRKSDFLNDSTINISVTNFFTNGFGKKNNNEIELFLTPDSLGNYLSILDSKGMTNHNENEIYQFARNTGCLLESDTTDIQMNRKFINAQLLAYQYTIENLLDFTKNVNVVDWSWESGYGNSASGKGIVRNNTTFNIPNVKYEIKYKDRYGNVITSDDGYVTHDMLRAGESKSFTFYSSYVGNASRASISLEFDEEMISEYVLDNEYSGNEYELYLAELEEDAGKTE